MVYEVGLSAAGALALSTACSGQSSGSGLLIGGADVSCNLTPGPGATPADSSPAPGDNGGGASPTPVNPLAPTPSPAGDGGSSSAVTLLAAVAGGAGAAAVLAAAAVVLVVRRRRRLAREAELKNADCVQVGRAGRLWRS